MQHKFNYFLEFEVSRSYFLSCNFNTKILEFILDWKYHKCSVVYQFNNNNNMHTQSHMKKLRHPI